MPCGPPVRLKPREIVVAVAGDLGEDLAEAERDDRQVVAAQSQRRQADDDAAERAAIAAATRTIQIEMWMPPMPGVHADAAEVEVDRAVDVGTGTRDGDASHAAV